MCRYKTFGFRVLFRMLSMADVVIHRPDLSMNNSSMSLLSPSPLRFSSSSLQSRSRDHSASSVSDYLLPMSVSSFGALEPTHSLQQTEATIDTLIRLLMQTLQTAMQFPRSDTQLTGVLALLEQLQKFVVASSSLEMLNHRQVRCRRPHNVCDCHLPNLVLSLRRCSLLSKTSSLNSKHCWRWRM